MEIVVPVQNLWVDEARAKTLKTGSFFFPPQYYKKHLNKKSGWIIFYFFWALAWTTFQRSLANVGQIFNSPRGREASRHDNSARRQYCILILLILVLFPFKQQLIPCVEVLAWTGAEPGTVLTRAGQELPWHNVPSPGPVFGAGLGVPAWPHSRYPHPTDKTKELQKSGRPNHTAEAVSLKTRKKE